MLFYLKKVSDVNGCAHCVRTTISVFGKEIQHFFGALGDCAFAWVKKERFDLHGDW